jgi:hypothetical protein
MYLRQVLVFLTTNMTRVMDLGFSVETLSPLFLLYTFKYSKSIVVFFLLGLSSITRLHVEHAIRPS